MAVPSDAARSPMHGATNMDTLIAIGTLAALSVSAVVAIALGGRHVHLGGGGTLAASLHGVMAPLIVAILATGRAVESRVRTRAARTLHSLLALRPPTARLVVNTEDEAGSGPAGERPGWRALAGPSGRVRSPRRHRGGGWSPLDESMLTGEPLPSIAGRGACHRRDQQRERTLVLEVGRRLRV